MRLREVLKKYNKLHLYEKIFELYGSLNIGRYQAGFACSEMAKAFDRAVQVIKTPVRSDYNISKAARSYAVGGSFEMIENGDYRGAVGFAMWIYNVAVKVIQNDAPEEDKAKYLESYQNAMDTLGFTSEQVIIERAKKLKELIPKIMEVAEYIIENNPNIIK
jgi:hypothetical protein